MHCTTLGDFWPSDLFIDVRAGIISSSGVGSGLGANGVAEPNVRERGGLGSLPNALRGARPARPPVVIRAVQRTATGDASSGVAVSSAVRTGGERESLRVAGGVREGEGEARRTTGGEWCGTRPYQT